MGISLAMNLDNWLAQRAQTCPDRTALVAEGRSLTYAELEAEATAAARRLAAQGVRRGAAVTLELPAGAEYVVLLHALMKLGAVADAAQSPPGAGRAPGRARPRAARAHRLPASDAAGPRPTCRCSASTTSTTSTAAS